MNHLPPMREFRVQEREARRRILAAGEGSGVSRCAKELAASVELPEAQCELAQIRALIEHEKGILNRLRGEIRQIENTVGPAPSRHPARLLIAIVARAHCLPMGHLFARRRYPPQVAARHHAMWLVRSVRTDMSYLAIGRVFGLDHTTIIHGVKNWAAIAEKYAPEILTVNEALGRTDIEPLGPGEVPFQ